MSRVMYDSTNPYDIPADAQMVAGYVDGLYAWPDAGWQRFPSARKVTITVGSGTLDANVADVENGDYDMAQGVAWAKRKIDYSQPATLYFSLSRAPEFYAEAARQGLQSFGWSLWIADYDNSPVLAPAWVAKQYANPTFTGRHYDLSIVQDYWPGVDPPPGYAPPPPPLGLPEHEVQVAWAKLGDVLGSILPSLNDRLVRTGTRLGEL